MPRSVGALLQTLLLLGVRFCDLLSLLLASQARRRVERIRAVSPKAVSDEVYCSLLGAEWSLWIGSMCSTRCLAYASLTLMAADHVLTAAFLTAALEFIAWQYLPMGVPFLVLDLLMTMILVFLWPSKQGRPFLKAALGWPLGLDMVGFLLPALWFIFLIFLGSVSQILYSVLWLQWIMTPEPTAIAIRMSDEVIWMRLTCPAPIFTEEEVPEYYSEIYGSASFIVVFVEMWWWGMQLLQQTTQFY